MKITVAYTDWLNTSVAVHCLNQRYDAQAIALCADVGQREPLANVRRPALDRGTTDVRLKGRVAGLALPSLGSVGRARGSSSCSSPSSARTA
jgi:argininosuccinate synthase